MELWHGLCTGSNVRPGEVLGTEEGEMETPFPDHTQSTQRPPVL